MIFASYYDKRIRWRQRRRCGEEGRRQGARCRTAPLPAAASSASSRNNADRTRRGRGHRQTVVKKPAIGFRRGVHLRRPRAASAAGAKPLCFIYPRLPGCSS
ncbi:hypothetical protein ACRAWF_32125 [Streptomyces sp. L7]